MAPLDRLPTRDGEGTLRAVLESPQGTRNKLAYDPVDDAFRVRFTLPVGMVFPFDFGFIPGTRVADGDPLDVLVLMDAPAFPGCVVGISLLGVLEAEQARPGTPSIRNDRLIALAEGSVERGRPSAIADLDPTLLDQIETFLETYERLRGKQFKVLRRRGPDRALRLLEDALTST